MTFCFRPLGRQRVAIAPRIIAGLSLWLAVPVAAAAPIGPRISTAAATRLTQAAIEMLGSESRRIEIRAISDPPRDPAAVTSSSPIIISVGDSRISPVPKVHANCTGDSAQRLITCDLRIVDDLLDRYFPGPPNEDRDKDRVQLLRLILAHEIGHVELGHPSAAYHGSEDGFSVIKYASYRIELEADEYGVGLIEAAALEAESYQTLVISLAAQAVRRGRCPETFPEPCPCPAGQLPMNCVQHPEGPGLVLRQDERISIALGGTHPALVVRFVRMLTLSRDPRIQEIYRPQAERVLEHLSVRNERGTAEPASNLFVRADEISLRQTH